MQAVATTLAWSEFSAACFWSCPSASTSGHLHAPAEAPGNPTLSTPRWRNSPLTLVNSSHIRPGRSVYLSSPQKVRRLFFQVAGHLFGCYPRLEAGRAAVRWDTFVVLLRRHAVALCLLARFEAEGGRRWWRRGAAYGISFISSAPPQVRTCDVGFRIISLYP
jgi:hypothetical protein